MKKYSDLSDPVLLAHAIERAGDEWQLAKHLGRNWKTVTVWRTRKRLPQGVREHLVLLLEHVLVEHNGIEPVHRPLADDLPQTGTDRHRLRLVRSEAP